MTIPAPEPVEVPADELAAAVEYARFAELRALKKGWDSYESRPIQGGVEARAKAILATLRTQPFICPTGEGGICLEWRASEDESIEIDVAPDNGLSAFIEDRELEDASSPNGPLARHKRAMVIIEANRQRIAELESHLARALPVVEAAGALIEGWLEKRERPRVERDDRWCSPQLDQRFDALAAAVRAAREPRTGEQE